MEFDIDVSGGDIFDKDYAVCIASKDGIIKGFKISLSFVSIIKSRYEQNLYRYKKSDKSKSLLKIRLYSIIIYYLFKGIKIRESLILNLCRDFSGREKDIENNLKYFLTEKLKIKIDKFNFGKLTKDSNADRYAYLMRKDKNNKMRIYIKIDSKDVEEFLK